MEIQPIHERIERVIDDNGEMSHRLYVNSVYYEKDGKYKEIDFTFKLDETGKEYQSHFISNENVFSCGLRNDNLVEKYLGFRNGPEHQLEFTPLEYTIDGKRYVFGDSFSEIILKEPNHIVHKIDDIRVMSTINTSEKLRAALGIREMFTTIEYKKRLDIKGFNIVNEKIVHSDGSVEFVLDEDKCFKLESADGKQLTIPEPSMWDSTMGAITNGLNHSLILKDGEYIYTKHTNTLGELWLSTKNDTIFIDAAIVYGSSGGEIQFGDDDVVSVNAQVMNIVGGTPPTPSYKLGTDRFVYIKFNPADIKAAIVDSGKEVIGATLYVYSTSTGSNIYPSNTGAINPVNTTSNPDWGIHCGVLTELNETIGGSWTVHTSTPSEFSPNRYILTSTNQNKYLSWSFSQSMTEAFFYNATSPNAVLLKTNRFNTSIPENDTSYQFTFPFYGPAYTDATKRPYISISYDTNRTVFVDEDGGKRFLTDAFYVRRNSVGPRGSWIDNTGYPGVLTPWSPEDFFVRRDHPFVSANALPLDSTNSYVNYANAGLVYGCFDTGTEYLFVIEKSSGSPTYVSEIDLVLLNKSTLKVSRTLFNVKALAGMPSDKTGTPQNTLKFAGVTYSKVNNRLTIGFSGHNWTTNASNSSLYDIVGAGHIVQVNIANLTVSNSYQTHTYSVTGGSSSTSTVNVSRRYIFKCVVQIGETEFAVYDDAQVAGTNTWTYYGVKFDNPTTKALISSSASSYIYNPSFLGSDGTYLYYYSVQGTQSSVSLCRVNTSGTIDTSFRTNTYNALASYSGAGTPNTVSSSSNLGIRAFAIMNDGKIHIRGYYSSSGTGEFDVLLHSTGSWYKNLLNDQFTVYANLREPFDIRRWYASPDGKVMFYTMSSGPPNITAVDTTYFVNTFDVNTGWGDFFVVNDKILGYMKGSAVGKGCFVEISLDYQNGFPARSSIDKSDSVRAYAPLVNDEAVYKGRYTTTSGALNSHYVYDAQGNAVYAAKRNYFNGGTSFDGGDVEVVYSPSPTHANDYNVKFTEVGLQKIFDKKKL